MFADFMDEENHEVIMKMIRPPPRVITSWTLMISSQWGCLQRYCLCTFLFSLMPSAVSWQFLLPQVVLLAHAEGETFGLPVGLSFGLLSAGYQFFSVPSLICTTRLADVYGRRPFFVVGFFGSCFGFLVIAFHQSFTPMLVAVMLGRAVGGVFSSSPSLAHAYISDIAGIKSENQVFTGHT